MAVNLDAHRMVQKQAAWIAQLQEELATTSTFLNMHDSQPEKAVMNMVDGINYDSFQIACNLVDDATPMISPRAPDHPDCTICATFSSRFPGVIPLLRDTDPRMDEEREALRVNIVQSTLLRVCHDFMQPWHVSSGDQVINDGNEELLKAVSDSIFQTESQVVAANWKAITYRHLSTLKRASETIERERMYECLCSALLPIWHVYGLIDDQIAPIVSETGMRDMFKYLIAEVYSFQKAAAQDIVSAELQPVMVPGGIVADERTMQIITGSMSTAPDSTILCTTRIGLRRITRVAGDAKVTLLMRPEVFVTPALTPSLVARHD
ncbi:unnamed protein product [Peniophora sp. CBMAI 1063]|nr:unnamed protein product [Peniophora sp. CBMAI 1063]